MKKLTQEEFYNNKDCHYYKWLRGKQNNVRGTFYWLCNLLSNESKLELSAYPNVLLLKSRTQYAPELVSQVLFLADKKL